MSGTTARKLLLFGFLIASISCGPTNIGDSWSKGPELPFPISNFATADRYLLGGDSSAIGYVNSNIYFDGNGFLQRAPIAIDEVVIDVKNSCAVFDGSRIYLFGGYSAGATDFLLTYDPSTDSWEDLGQLPYRTYGCSATIVQGEIHIIGGDGTKAHYRFFPSSNTFLRETPPLYSHDLGCAVSLDGYIYLIGGGNDRVERYDPQSDQWEEVRGLGISLRGHSCATMEGRIFVLGGEMDNGNINAQVLMYDPTKDEWQAISDIPTPRKFAGAIVFGNQIHFVGGIDDNGNRTAIDEIFVPATR